MLLMPQYDHQVHCTYVTVSFGAVVVTVLDTCNRSQWRLSKRLYNVAHTANLD